MTANKIDTTKYNAMVANASPNVKISSTVFKNFIGDVKSVVDHNADEVDAAMKKTADSDLNMNNNNITNINTIHFRGSQTLTIDGSKSITINRTMHRVTTAGGADELHTINGGNENDLLLLRIVTGSNPVTIKHRTGNINTPDGVDVSLTDVRQWVLMVKASADWFVIASGVGLNRAGDKIMGPFVLGLTGDGHSIVRDRGSDSPATMHLDFSGLSTASATVAFFRNLNTSGNKAFVIFRGDGTNTSVFRVLNGEIDRLNGQTVTVTAYNGNPEGNVAAPPGSICLNTSGGAGTSFYVKESGTGNTGWVAK